MDNSILSVNVVEGEDIRGNESESNKNSFKLLYRWKFWALCNSSNRRVKDWD